MFVVKKYYLFRIEVYKTKHTKQKPFSCRHNFNQNSYTNFNKNKKNITMNFLSTVHINTK